MVLSGAEVRARSFASLAAGERLSAQAARAEARLAADPALERMFARQSAQEGRHAWLFTLAAGRLGLATDSAASDAWFATLPIARRIDAAEFAGDLATLVVATQGALEALGAAVLEGVASLPVARPFAPFLALVLAEERAHQRIGRRAIARLVAARRLEPQAIEPMLMAARRDGAHSLEQVFDRLQTRAELRALIAARYEALVADFGATLGA